MKSISFTVPGQPAAKGRPRISTSGGHIRSYTPEKTVRYENRVQSYAAIAMGGQHPMGGPIELVFEACMIIPPSWSLKKRLAAAAGQIQPTSKPDLDNLEKALLDGMNRVVFIDDAQITKVTKSKSYSNTPRLIVTVTGLGQ